MLEPAKTTLAALRESVPLTRAELSARARISRNQLGRLERRECIPTIPTARRLARALRVPPATVLALFPRRQVA